MSEYNFQSIEQKWQNLWDKNQTYHTNHHSKNPKYYILDMFPYPSGAGLHVGHPLGYVASDIVSRYKRLKGFNVLHPMGFDSFGLPAEQYAIQTGQHPAKTTEENIKTYISQLKKLGLSYDWTKEVRTSNADFYRWTQWIFAQIFDSWYNKKTDQAESIKSLIQHFNTFGTTDLEAVCEENLPEFSAEEWMKKSEEEQYRILLDYRLTYLAETFVNWCPALGSVLSNDEVKEGVSERGGFPVEQKKMKQWMMRITAYADRLLKGLESIDWTDSLKEQQRNWIGKSQGASVIFSIENRREVIEVFTTRVDTLFGVTFLVLAPEHPFVEFLVTQNQRQEVEKYNLEVKNRSDLERMVNEKKVSGVFTGSFALHPITNEKIPIWLADYVLMGYGTGAVMAVPSGDQRDWNFAKKFDLKIISILDAQQDIAQQVDATKKGKYINSDFINGLDYQEATNQITNHLEAQKKGKKKINYRLRDAVFSRQRYWGEPVPIFFKNGLPYLLNDNELPLTLPSVDKYLPTESGEPPLGRAKDWKHKNTYEYELSTMPGWAGSSWYWYRYMDAQNEQEFASKKAISYWKDVDLYVGGTEHATGHLLYSRFWNKILKDLGFVGEEEPFKKLINQGMIQGRSSFVYRLKNAPKITYISHSLLENYETIAIHVPVSMVSNDELDIEKFKKYRAEAGETDIELRLDKGKYTCGWEVEKMSKAKFNVVNPDDVIAQFGADTFRLYEMFLGPLEQSKPWNTQGIDGCFRFLKRLWRLFYDEKGAWKIDTQTNPTSEELKVIHTCIQKIESDIERYSFNTAVSNLMVTVNQLTDLKCVNSLILNDLMILISPFCPHLAEELWEKLGHKESISVAKFPVFEAQYIQEDSFEYPISINGKVRTKIIFSNNLSIKDIENQVIADETIQKWLAGNPPKKVIVVPKKIVNVVV